MENIPGITEIKLAEAKSKIRLFGLDYDGTVYNGIDYKLDEVLALVTKTLSRNKSIAFVTARAATVLEMLSPALQVILRDKNYVSRIFIAGGNGAILFEVTKNGLIEIYNHGFDLLQIKSIVKTGLGVYKKLSINKIDLADTGTKIFAKFLQKSWVDYIPQEIVDICKIHKGLFFAEEAKVTFVLPKDSILRDKFIFEIRQKLGDGYCAVVGDYTYIHVTRRLAEDGKRVAIKTILELMDLKLNEVVTFGDMPNDNDAGLLSFPYSFTNAQNFSKDNQEKPPYLLKQTDFSPIAMVYETVNYLIER